MHAPSRRAFLGLATSAIATAAIGAAGVRLIGVAEAMPVDPDLGRAGESAAPVMPAQWGPSPGPGWGSPGWGAPPPRPAPPRRRRRWVCWWHRGRRHCGWRWR
ncbi:twin-arginine translocation signal domain-containing protein [Bradyrhizobium sp. Cp5.3]|uniref:twin-arginine translocation signal domain-containing protein n=1 Tax=Bradyrhizobium TaxID=374 RepID=UPI000B07085D|nr:twin-arginine translocation signal domain-containing protein [Bradyrhizobium sp. Cp5.3]